MSAETRHELARPHRRGVYRARCGVRLRARDYGRFGGHDVAELEACAVCLELGEAERALELAKVWARVDAGEGRHYRETSTGALELELRRRRTPPR